MYNPLPRESPFALCPQSREQGIALQLHSRLGDREIQVVQVKLSRDSRVRTNLEFDFLGRNDHESLVVVLPGGPGDGVGPASLGADEDDYRRSENSCR